MARRCLVSRVPKRLGQVRQVKVWRVAAGLGLAGVVQPGLVRCGKVRCVAARCGMAC